METSRLKRGARRTPVLTVLIDIVHPAHVHFYRHIIRGLKEKGHKVFLVGRDKDVTCHLLDAFNFEYRTVPRSADRSRFGQISELVRRDWFLWKLAMRIRPHVVLTRNPAGVQAARFSKSIGIFDTDDGTEAGIHFRAAAPFAHYITTPTCFSESYGAKHVRYAGYKQLAYLHPDQFQPDPAIQHELGVTNTEPYYLLRFVAMDASHDRGEHGLSAQLKRQIVERLQKSGRVFISSESALPADLASLRIAIPPERMHDALAYASLLIGDSATMAAEAAVLGTPSIYSSTFAGRLPYLNELEYRYGLTRNLHPEDGLKLFDSLNELLANKSRGLFEEQRRRMLTEKINVADWYVKFVESLCRPI